MLLAHISDLHLDGTARSGERVSRVMDHLRGLPIDALLVTGDIADHGATAEYKQARRLLAAPFPVLTCPGNHDARSAYRTVLLGEHADETPVNRAHRVGDAAVLMCDSTIPANDEGLLAPETLAWLAERLAELRGTPTLIAFHHVPVALHHPTPDAIGLGRPDDLAAIVSDHPDVVAVLVGHAHTAAATTFAGRPLLAAPGVTWRLRMPWEGTGLADRTQPPGLAYHILDDSRRLTTQYRVVV